MSSLLIIILFGLLGLVFGSFAGATVWRLRAAQLRQDKESEEPIDSVGYKRLKPLIGRSMKQDRSQCLECGHELHWYDLLPLASWLSTSGKCRYCHRSIGFFEPAMEIGTAVLFGVFAAYWIGLHGLTLWPLFTVWIIILICMVILFAYDAKWFLLPDIIMIPLTALALIIALARIVQSLDAVQSIIGTGLAILILSGLYLALWLISKGAWIGFGDVKLGLVLGLLLGDWRLAFLTLFLSNLIGLVIVLPGMLRGKLSRQTHIPFGPLLIGGFFISLLWGEVTIAWYADVSMDLANILVSLML